MRVIGAATKVAFLGVLAACSRQGEPASSPASVAPARVYAGNCSPCHQDDGRGVMDIYPPLAGSPVVLGDPAVLARWVLRGERAASMPPGRYRGAMPQFGWMKDADAAALFSWLRTQFGNRAPAVETASVTRALASEAGH